MVMTPGTYLSKRRYAAGLTIEDVAERIDTIPHMLLHERREWLARIEDDIDRPGKDVIGALSRIFRFDILVLSRLLDLQEDVPATITEPRVCRSCACSWRDACKEKTGFCSWAEHDLCSACALALAASRQRVA